jgi:hypothetical protein
MLAARFSEKSPRCDLHNSAAASGLLQGVVDKRCTAIAGGEKAWLYKLQGSSIIHKRTVEVGVKLDNQVGRQLAQAAAPWVKWTSKSSGEIVVDCKFRRVTAIPSSFPLMSSVEDQHFPMSHCHRPSELAYIPHECHECSVPNRDCSMIDLTWPCPLDTAENIIVSNMTRHTHLQETTKP